MGFGSFAEEDADDSINSKPRQFMRFEIYSRPILPETTAPFGLLASRPNGAVEFGRS